MKLRSSLVSSIRHANFGCSFFGYTVTIHGKQRKKYNLRYNSVYFNEFHDMKMWVFVLNCNVNEQ